MLFLGFPLSIYSLVFLGIYQHHALALSLWKNSSLQSPKMLLCLPRTGCCCSWNWQETRGAREALFALDVVHQE